MKIILTAIDSKLADAWKEFFHDQENVSVIVGDITEVECDAIVLFRTSLFAQNLFPLFS